MNSFNFELKICTLIEIWKKKSKITCHAWMMSWRAVGTGIDFYIVILYSKLILINKIICIVAKSSPELFFFRQQYLRECSRVVGMCQKYVEVFGMFWLKVNSEKISSLKGTQIFAKSKNIKVYFFGLKFLNKSINKQINFFQRHEFL